MVFIPTVCAAAPAELTLRHEHHIFVLRPSQYPSWRSVHEEWRYAGRQFRAPQALRIDGDDVSALPPGITRTTLAGWDEAAMTVTLQAGVATVLDRPAGTVTIRRNGSGPIVFEGAGLPGRHVDVRAAAILIAHAMEAGVSDISLPVVEDPPVMHVEDPTLLSQGIREVVTVGESDFSGSPMERRHNIAVGLARFNGYLIAQGSVFSFNEVLGPVSAAAGYTKELVILGERTLPDYGGGLCQVSTTAYRGAWEYGLPIVARRNHSFAVRYYGPQGTDATIYPPQTDLRFTNDTPGALLLQTHVEKDRAYFIYYGTRDARLSAIYGPYTWDQSSPPSDRSEYTVEIPPGTTRKVGDKVPGMHAAWFRVVEKKTQTGTLLQSIDPVYSIYEARPLFTQIGVEEGSSLLKSSASGEVNTSFSSQSSSRSSKAKSAFRPARRRD